MNPSPSAKTGIYGTDLTKPMSVLIEQVRTQLTQARGQITDMERAFPGWQERVHHVAGLLTCGIVALYDAKQELAAFEAKRNGNPEKP